MPSYLLEGSDYLTLQNEIDKIVKEQKFVEALTSTYDLEETTLEKALEDLDTYSFLSEKKIVIIKNIEVINQEENKKDIEHLYKYIEKPNTDNLLIIVANKLNNVLKITKELKKRCQYKKCEFDDKNYIKKAFSDYDVERGVEELLKEYCKDDITKLGNECLKLKDYKADEKKITKDDVKKIVMIKLEDDPKQLTFDFVRCLAEKDKKAALKKYQELLDYNIEPLSIVGLLASQIRIMYQVKVLEKDSLSNREIASILGEKSDYRISKTKELTRYYSEEELLHLMTELGKIDLGVKSRSVDANFLIELFIINM